jgi:hypothetical protein
VAGETRAAAADKSERPCGKGKLTPSAAGGTSEAAVPALPAAGETSAAAADTAERLSKLAGYSYKVPRSDPQKLPREFSGSTRDTGWLHRQGSGDDSGKILLWYPDGGRDSVVLQGGQGLQQDALQAPEEKRKEEVV